MTHLKATENPARPQAKRTNFHEIFNVGKGLASKIGGKSGTGTAFSLQLQHYGSGPHYPDTAKSVDLAQAYAEIPRGRSAPRMSLLERIDLRKRLAANFIVPEWLKCQLPDYACAVLTQLCRMWADGGTVEPSNLELAALTGLNVRNVQRGVRALEDRAIMHVTRRPRPGAKHLPNVYRLICGALTRWITRCREQLLIGWRKCRASKKEIESSLKPAQKIAPKTFEETEMALRKAEPNAFTDFLIGILKKAEARPKRE